MSGAERGRTLSNTVRWSASRVGLAVVMVVTVLGGVLPSRVGAQAPKNQERTSGRGEQPSTLSSESLWSPIPDGAVVDNGTVRMGISQVGSIITTDGDTVGLEYLPTGGDVLTPACHCEGWGIADLHQEPEFPPSGGGGGGGGPLGGDPGDPPTALSSSSSPSSTAFADSDRGLSWNLDVVDFTASEDRARSVVEAPGLFRVTHDFRPLANVDELYAVSVSIENLTGDWARPLYRRTLDWDVPPTEFWELVSSEGSIPTYGSASFASNDGFLDPNPFVEPTGIAIGGSSGEGAWGDFIGPEDQGYQVDLDFGQIGPSGTVEFTLLYGAAADEPTARGVIEPLAHLFSLARPAPDGGPTPPGPVPMLSGGVDDDGSPNTFMFGVRRERVELLGDDPSLPIVGDPVNAATGNLILQESDLGVGPGLDLVRAYNSQGSRVGVLGRGWTTPWDAAAEPADAANPVEGDVSLWMPDGRVVRFAYDDPDWSPPVGLEGAVLSPSLDGLGAFAGWEVVFRGGETWVFDASGLLAGVGLADGQDVEITRDGSGRPATVTNGDAGRRLVFDWSVSGVVTVTAELWDPALGAGGWRTEVPDRSVHLSLDGPGGELSAVERPDGSAERYSYGSAGLEIVERLVETGNPEVWERVIENEYDGFGRVVRQVGASGQVDTFDYNVPRSGSTTVTFDANGSAPESMVYEWDALGQTRGIVDPFGQRVDRTWEGNSPAAFVDRSGAAFAYLYDAHQRPLRRFYPDPQTGAVPEVLDAPTASQDGLFEEFTYWSCTGCAPDDPRVATHRSPDAMVTSYTYLGLC